MHSEYNNQKYNENFAGMVGVMHSDQNNQKYKKILPGMHRPNKIRENR